MDHHESLRVDVWSDIVCPWCAIGKANLDLALADFAHRDLVEVVWHSFELDPNAPAVRSGSYVEMLGRKYGQDAGSAQAMVDQMTERGAAAGVEFRFDRVQPGNTFDAHRIIHLAADRGIQTPVKERFLRGYLSEGEAVGLPETVARLAVDAGLAADEVDLVLASDAYAEDVRADEALAGELQVSGVPFFVIDRRYGVAGAQPPAVLLQVLDQAWDERKPALTVLPGDDAGACGPDGCEV